jgi:hypothetical protein
MIPLNTSSSFSSHSSASDSFLIRNQARSSDLSSPQGDYQGSSLSLVRTQSSLGRNESSGDGLLSRVNTLSRGFTSSQSLESDLGNSLVESTASKILFGNTALTSSLDHQELTIISKQHIQAAASGDGTLSMQRHRQEVAKVDQVIQKAIKDQNEKNQQIIERVCLFNQRIESAVLQILGAHQTIMLRLNQDNADQSILDNFNISFKATENIITLLERSFRMTIVACQTINISEEAKDAIELIFQARQKDISLYCQQIELIQKTETHHLQMALQVYEAKLREQNDLFERYIDLRELKNTEIQAQADRELKCRAQGHQERMDAQKLLLEQQIVHFAHELDVQKEANQHENEQLRVKTHKDLQIRAINAEQKIRSKQLDVEQDIAKCRLQKEETISLESIRADERMLEKRLQFDHIGRFMELKVNAGIERDRIEADRAIRLREASMAEAVGLANAAAQASRCSIM